MSIARALGLALGVSLLTGCMGARYIPQAAGGQLKLMTRGRKIHRAIEDSDTPPHVAELLKEVSAVRRFGAERGLEPSKSYRRYVAFDREYVVWFVTGSERLSFEPKVYWFPIAGSFAGVGWFKEKRGARHVRRLERQGFDGDMRGAAAYSTGGWFRDPVVSSMLDPEPWGHGDLANTLLHETLHATVLVKGQTYFNESLASFVADTMTPEFLSERYGPDSPELASYVGIEEFRRERQARVLGAYVELEALYASNLDDATKLRRKETILTELAQDLELAKRPNNASLLGAKLYGTGMSDFRALLGHCGGDWRRFIAAVKSLQPRHFETRQLEDFAPVVRTLMEWQCEPLPRRK